MHVSTVQQEQIDTSNHESNSLLHWLGIELRPPGGWKQKAQFAVSISSATAAGFVATLALQSAHDYFFPDAEHARIIVLGEQIDGRVKTIEALSNSISKGLETGDRALNETLQSDTKKLLTEIRALQPEIYAAGKIAGRAQTLLADTKYAEMQKQNFSMSSDFLLSPGQGATVCPERYVFGVSSLGEKSVSARLSGAGNTVGSTLEPGGSISLRKEKGGVVQVMYQGMYGEPEAPRYGFSINCTN